MFESDSVVGGIDGTDESEVLGGEDADSTDLNFPTKSIKELSYHLYWYHGFHTSSSLFGFKYDSGDFSNSTIKYRLKHTYWAAID